MDIKIAVAGAQPVGRGPEAVQADWGGKRGGQEVADQLQHGRPPLAVRLTLGRGRRQLQHLGRGQSCPTPANTRLHGATCWQGPNWATR